MKADTPPEARLSPPRLAYLVRCWLVETEHGPVWRASIEDSHTTVRRRFADLDALFTFLEETTGAYLTQDNIKQIDEEQ